MTKFIAVTAAATLVGAGTIVATPAAQAAPITPGPVTIELTKCGDPSAPGSQKFIPDCSYSYLKSKTPLFAPYTIIAAPSPVTLVGTAAEGLAMSFPASGQEWPKLTGLSFGATSKVTPKDMTGTLDASGKVTLNLDYAVEITAAGATCTLSGKAVLSSAATDSLGGGVGSPFDPATGKFAAASESPLPTPALSGSCDTLTSTAADVTAGMGWFFAGTIKPEAPTPKPVKDKQTAKVTLAKSLKKKGKTVLLDKAVITNIGKAAKVKVSWGPKKSAKGNSKKLAKVRSDSYGRVTMTTTGKAKKLFVKVRLSAPATSEYDAYKYTGKVRTK